MTRRAVAIGLTCAAFLCSVTYFNQSVIRQSAIVGNYMPLSVYGTLIVVLVLLNPLLTWIRPAWRLKGKELAVILAMVLASCGIAESGFLKTFTNVIMLPNHYQKTNPGWHAEDTGTFDQLPKHMLADPGPDTDEKALSGFFQGKLPTEKATPGMVPWQQWKAPLLTWLPMMALLIIGFTALGLVVHRQWSKNEKLPYPIATFTKSLMDDGEGNSQSALRKRAFWVAAGLVLAIHLINFAAVWFPEYLISIPTRFDLTPLRRIIPYYMKSGMGWNVLYCRVYVSIIGIAFLVSSDISFSFAAVPFVGAMVLGMLATYGVSFRAGGEHRASIYTSLNIGSFVAYLIMIAYFGRRHYWNVIRRSLGFKTDDDVTTAEVWGGRTFILCTAAVTVMMTCYGLPFPLACVYMFMITAFYVCVARVVAQTGLLVMKPAWVPHIMLLGLFGNFALGPKAALIAMFFSAVLFAEGRETVMPYICNSLSLSSKEGQDKKLGRIASLAAGAAIIGMVVGLGVMLYLQYYHGTNMKAGRWFTHHVPTYPFSISADIARQLKAQGRLGESQELSAMGRVLNIWPDRKFAISFIVGALLVIISYIGRIRMNKWPINPAVFLLWSWSHCSKLTFSFFVGWVIKTLVTRYGGPKVGEKVKIIMIGLIAGDMLGALIPSIISAIYFFVTGEPPKQFNIMP